MNQNWSMHTWNISKKTGNNHFFKNWRKDSWLIYLERRNFFKSRISKHGGSLKHFSLSFLSPFVFIQFPSFIADNKIMKASVCVCVYTLYICIYYTCVCVCVGKEGSDRMTLCNLIMEKWTQSRYPLFGFFIHPFSLSSPLAFSLSLSLSLPLSLTKLYTEKMSLCWLNSLHADSPSSHISWKAAW